MKQKQYASTPNSGLLHDHPQISNVTENNLLRIFIIEADLCETDGGMLTMNKFSGSAGQKYDKY